MNESKLDKIAERIEEIRIDLAEIRKDINYHIRRTDLAEDNIRMLRVELKPVEVHVERVNGGLKLLGLILVVAAVVKVIIEFL